MTPRTTLYSGYYSHHKASKAGAMASLCMLTAVGVIFLFGIFHTYKEHKVSNVETKEQQTISLRIYSKVEEIAEKGVTKVQAQPVQRVQRLERKVVPKGAIKHARWKEKKQEIQESVKQEKPVTVEKSATTSVASKPVPTKSDTVSQKRVTTEEKPSLQNKEGSIDALVQSLTTAIGRNKTYPRVARRAGYEGVVFVEVVVGKNGIIKRYSIQKSSGYGVLDQAGIRLIEKIANSLNFSGKLVDDAIIVIPIQYELE